ncbi:MAG TPA: hypothetical protein VGP40_00865, partial [Chthoniobacterales bacterium]|nr:hypothetical protein [Chthoniobacterales bacterium]
ALGAAGEEAEGDEFASVLELVALFDAGETLADAFGEAATLGEALALGDIPAFGDAATLGEVPAAGEALAVAAGDAAVPGATDAAVEAPVCVE